jgi:RNA polymerase sigma-70 factor (ECF subfamily)
MTSRTDRELLIAAADGEESAFADLYGRHAPSLRQYFLSALAGNAVVDDLVQQVFIQLLDSKAFQDPRRGPESLRPLLYTIAKNLLRNQFRGDGRRSEREGEYQSRHTQTIPPIEPADDSINQAIAELPDHHRRPLLLRFRHGMSVHHIADLLDCPPGTVKSRLHYALKRLGQLLHPIRQEDKLPRK